MRDVARCGTLFRQTDIAQIFDHRSQHRGVFERNVSAGQPDSHRRIDAVQSFDRVLRFLGLADVRLIRGQPKVDRHEIRVEKRAFAEVRLGIIVTAGIMAVPRHLSGSRAVMICSPLSPDPAGDQ